MMKELLLGIDIGTTSTKAVLFNSYGEILAQSLHEYQTSYPYPGWAEQNPTDWWDAACKTVHQVIDLSNRSPSEIAALGVSCQAPTMLAINNSGEPLYPAMIWMDRRSEPQCGWLEEKVGAEKIIKINGGRIDPYYLASKILWFKVNKPELYKQTKCFLQANGFIVYKLTNRISMDVSHGPLTQLFNSREQNWSNQLVEIMQIDPMKLPPVYPCATIVGEVTERASVDIGLEPGTPVVAGAVDGVAAALEAGVTEVGDAAEMTGQSTVLLICNDQPYLDDLLIPLIHAIPNKYLVIGAMVSTGGALRWFRDQLGGVEIEAAKLTGLDAFDLLSMEARNSSVGANSLIFLPYMFGERSPIWDSSARGVYFGISLATRKEDLIRAIMEGSAYGLKHNVEIAALSGFFINQLICVGGGAKSEIWNQIKADVLGKHIKIPSTATGAPLGDAILAAVAIDLYSNIPEAVNSMVHFSKAYIPDPMNTKLYEKYFSIYKNLYSDLKKEFKKLAEVDNEIS